MLTGRCQRLTLNEKVIVTAEVGDLRQVRRVDGTTLWTNWQWLGISLDRS